jgi:catechol 2,3-dioxygenase-like lactoylglutathione lyase family enzyme
MSTPSNVSTSFSTSFNLGSQKIVAFVATRDPAAAKRFYQETLGLRLIGEDRFATMFDVNGTMLRVTHVPDWTPPRFTVFGWEVTDIVTAVTELGKAGVRFERYMPDQDELNIWTSPSGPGVDPAHGGARVAWFKDPDGNVLSVTALPV